MKNVSQEAYQRQRMIKYSEKHSVSETAIVLVKLFCNTLFDKYLTVTSLHRC